MSKNLPKWHESLKIVLFLKYCKIINTDSLRHSKAKGGDGGDHMDTILSLQPEKLNFALGARVSVFET